MSEPELAQRFFATFPHEASSVWWQREFAVTTGFDPLTEPFDTDAGFVRRTSGRFDALVLRTDLSDASKTAILRDWLPTAGVADVGRANQNDHQAPPELAERLRSAVRRHPDYVHRMMNLPAVRHFWSDAQRQAMAARWLS